MYVCLYACTYRVQQGKKRRMTTMSGMVVSEGTWGKRREQGQKTWKMPKNNTVNQAFVFAVYITIQLEDRRHNQPSPALPVGFSPLQSEANMIVAWSGAGCVGVRGGRGTVVQPKKRLSFSIHCSLCPRRNEDLSFSQPVSQACTVLIRPEIREETRRGH